MKCEYGCEQKAEYQLNNKKWCCSKSYNSCPAIRKKSSNSLKKLHKNGTLSARYFDGKRGWAKGLTKNTHNGLKSMGEITSKRLLKLGNDNPLVKWNKNKPRETYERISKTRKRLFKEGKLEIPTSSRRGKTSYFIINGKKFFLRSTYEFIFALYLVYKNINFEYENIIVCHNNISRKNDFEIDGKLYEIKGYKSDKDLEIKNAFESNGYEIRFVYTSTINEIIKYLKRQKIDVDYFLNKIHEFNNKKQHFIFNYAQLVEWDTRMV